MKAMKSLFSLVLFLLFAIGAFAQQQTTPPSDSSSVPTWQHYNMRLYDVRHYDMRLYEPFRCQCVPVPRDTLEVSPYEYLQPSQAALWEAAQQKMKNVIKSQSSWAGRKGVTLTGLNS